MAGVINSGNKSEIFYWQTSKLSFELFCKLAKNRLIEISKEMGLLYLDDYLRYRLFYIDWNTKHPRI